MTGQTNVAPTIIKRKKVVSGDGHHGGAWKVAYADFVTAMMAFFMMMWLLTATTETQRHGLADYFSPSIPLSRQSAGSDGVLSGDSAFTQDMMTQTGVGSLDTPPDDDPAMADAEDVEFGRIEDALTQVVQDDAVTNDLMGHVAWEITDEGLVVELFDLDDASLFEAETARPTPLLRALAQVIEDAARLVTSALAIEGHVTAEPVVQIDNPVWSLSASRADQMRTLLGQSGMPDARIRRITGHADRDPAVPDPMAARNNRIEVIFLRE